MKRVSRSCFMFILICGLLLPGGRSYAEEITKKTPPTKVKEYQLDWVIGTKEFGYLPVYFDAYGGAFNYRDDLDYGTPVTLKNGDTYFIVWNTNDNRINNMLSLNAQGKVNWIFKPKVAFDSFFHPVVDQEGNFYYTYKIKGESDGIHYLQAVNNQGKIKWTKKFILKSSDYKIHDFWLRTNEKEILFSSGSKNFIVSTKDGSTTEFSKNQQLGKLIMGENDGYVIFLDNRNEEAGFSIYEVYDKDNKLKYKIKEKFNASPWLSRAQIQLMKDGSVLMGFGEFDRGSRFIYYNTVGKRVWQHQYPFDLHGWEYFSYGGRVYIGGEMGINLKDEDKKMWVLDLATGNTVKTFDNSMPEYIGSYEGKFQRGTRLDTVGPSNMQYPNDLSLYANINYSFKRLNTETLEPVDIDTENILIYSLTEAFGNYMVEKFPNDPDITNASYDFSGRYTILSRNNNTIYFYYHSKNLKERSFAKAQLVERPFDPIKDASWLNNWSYDSTELE